MSQKKTEDYLELLEFLLLKMARISIEPEEGNCSRIIERCKKCSVQLDKIIKVLEALDGFSFLLNKNMEVEK